jgi:hypothetical protein
MNKRTQLTLLLVVLGVVDAVIPFFPILALLLVYVLVERPAWFLHWVEELYGSE